MVAHYLSKIVARVTTKVLPSNGWCGNAHYESLVWLDGQLVALCVCCTQGTPEIMIMFVTLAHCGALVLRWSIPRQQELQVYV